MLEEVLRSPPRQRRVQRRLSRPLIQRTFPHKPNSSRRQPSDAPVISLIRHLSILPPRWTRRILRSSPRGKVFRRLRYSSKQHSLLVFVSYFSCRSLVS